MAIPIILRQISYSLNTNILLVNFVFLGEKNGAGGGGAAQAHQPSSLLDSPLGSREMLPWKNFEN